MSGAVRIWVMRSEQHWRHRSEIRPTALDLCGADLDLHRDPCAVHRCGTRPDAQAELQHDCDLRRDSIRRLRLSQPKDFERIGQVPRRMET